MTVLVILLSGLWSLGSSSTLKHPYHSMKYHYVNLNKTWTEAQQYCRDNFVDLATLENEDDMAAMISVTGNNAQFWIGFRGRWAWTLDESTFRNWSGDQPNIGHTEESCAQVLAAGIWSDYYCTGLNGVLCYNNASNQYILADTPMTWFEGQKYCRENYTDLATIRNKEDNKKAFSLLTSSLGNNISHARHAWIGLHRSFSWSDNSTSSFRMWTGDIRHPGSDFVPGLQGEKDPCASVLDGKWKSVDCSENKLPFVCYEVVPDFKKRVVKIELSPAGLNNLEDLNNPDTQDAILKQIKEKMVAQGHHGDLKIKWKIQPDGKIFHKKTPDVTPDVCEDD